MRGQALDHAVRRDLSRSLRLLPGQDFLANRVARQVEFPLEQLPCQQPMITALGLPDFWQFSVEALFAKAIGWLDAPAVRDGLIPGAGADGLLRLAVPSQIPTRFRWFLLFSTNLRAEQLNRHEASLFA